ncbi:hypothetical protein [Mesorhizobium tamadayense]|uniref:hypothetical protein n=1 Tax=Mesorhizobium tamadayense TaxID=425306 RepID=UPI001FE1FA9C|nr:hypothetical protein [Mesorhizobium tamadayense]
MPAGGGLSQGLRVNPPERLTVGHDVSEFRNGRHPSLDDWLRNRALAGEGLSARTYVVCNADAKDRVIGYYAISTAMEERIALPSARLRRGMPEQVPPAADRPPGGRSGMPGSGPWR